jgi:light-regulated signal transduction histidine kinase (bacteriophytochrome)
MTLLELVDTNATRPAPAAMPEEMTVMREYTESLVRKLEERNARLERARGEIMRANAGLERRVQERTSELVASNKELEAFSHSIAHDLRSPLMAIDGFSHILISECEGRVPPKSMDHLRYIGQAVRLMNDLTSDLLRLSRASRAEIRRHTVDLSGMAREIVKNLRELDPERRVEVQIAEGIKAQADPALLRIVLENLIGNAWKFTSRTPNARIDAGLPAQDRTYCIRDNGAGFDMAAAGLLFNAFQRLHLESDFPGTGIGLTTVERIIKRHGGSIRAEGAVGQGAAFFFDLGTADARPGLNGGHKNH